MDGLCGVSRAGAESTESVPLALPVREPGRPAHVAARPASAAARSHDPELEMLLALSGGRSRPAFGGAVAGAATARDAKPAQEPFAWSYIATSRVTKVWP